jgi:predicted permease
MSEARRWLSWDLLSQDLRLGLRILAKNPGSTVIAALTLALAIGLNTAIFSVLNAALLRALPVDKPQELVMLTDPNASMVLGGLLSGERSVLSYSEFIALRDRTATMSGLCASQLPLWRWPVRISGGPPEEAHGRLVSENYFSVFGIRPALGRFFTQQDATGVGKDPYVVISYDYWQRRFRGNKAVIGMPIRFYKATLVILGVAAKDFRGETVGQDPDVWLPMLMQPVVMPGTDGLGEYMDRSYDKLMWLHVFGRRKAGVDISQVQAEVNVLFGGILAAGYPLTMPPQDRKRALDQRIRVRSIRNGAFHGRDEFSEEWFVLAGLAGLVLFVACANVANLLLARASSRDREVAVRLSIGADRARLIRQFLVESLLLAALGGIAGTAVAILASHTLLLVLSAAPDSLEFSAGLDLRVLAFTASAALLTGIAFGLFPALRGTRTAVSKVLKEAGRGATAGREGIAFARVLVAAQVALSFLLVIGAGLFLRTLRNLQSVGLGYPAQNLLLVEVDASGAGSQGRTVNLFGEMADRIRRIPDVIGVTWSDRGLFSGFDGAFAIEVEGFSSRSESDRGSTGDSIGPGYFSTIGIPMQLGREISPQDTARSRPVCVINEAFARHFFPGRNPIGSHVSYAANDNTRRLEVIGVAQDARVNSLRGKIEPKFYTAAEQTRGGSWLEIRTAGNPTHLINQVRNTILALNRDLDVRTERTVAETLAAQTAQPRLIARLSSIFGILALVLAATGIYGVLSYRVARRTNEIGIRMALGAGKPRIVGTILEETGLMVAAGVAIGLAMAAATAQLVAGQLYEAGATGPRWSLARYQHVDSATQLYGVTAMDPFTIVSTVALLGSIALLSAYIPARRAAEVDPVNALRHE